MAEMNDDEDGIVAGLETMDLEKRIPIVVGRTSDVHSSFFDSFRQGLAQLGKMATVQELRTKCLEFADNEPPAWFLRAIANNSYAGATPEEVASYKTDIIGFRSGDPDVEGRILCHFYDTKIYILYRYLDTFYLRSVINESGSKITDNIDFTATNAIFISDVENEYFQPVNVMKSKICINDPQNIYENSVAGSSLNQFVGRTSDANEETKKESREILLHNLKALEYAIRDGDIDKVKHINKILNDNNLLNKHLSMELGSNSASENFLIISACKHKRADILHYLLHESNILYYLKTENTSCEQEDYQRRLAFRYAMCSDNFDMVDALYSYWCSNMHWSAHDHVVNNEAVDNLCRISRLLDEARTECEDCLARHQQMYVDVHCLIQYNLYQIELYTELQVLKSGFDDSDNLLSVTENVRLLIIKILDTHEKCSDINKIRLEKYLPDEEETTQNLLADESTHYIKSLLYLMYEVYYRKIDFNTSLLLLDNLHYLKQRLKTPEQSYQKIECALYYFIYRIAEDWRLYLSSDRPTFSTQMLGVHDGIFITMKAINDPQKILNGPVLYFEREHFQKSLSEFKKVIKETNVSENIRNEKLPNDEINSLTLLPYMRDDYSLKRMLHYIEVLLSVDFQKDSEFGILIIERVVQVIGEMFKSTEESFHLSKTTRALLQMTISVETIKNLEYLRTFLSHAEDGQLSKRIDIAKGGIGLFQEVYEDLKKIMERIKTVLELYKPILNMSLIWKGLRLLSDRLDQLPDNIRFYTAMIQGIFQIFSEPVYGPIMFCNLEKDFLNRTWYKFGYTRQLFREIGLLKINIEQLSIKEHIIKRQLFCTILKQLPKYNHLVGKTLNAIADNNKMWSYIKGEMSQHIVIDVPDYPTQSDIEKVKTKLSSLIKRSAEIDHDLLHKVSCIQDYTHHWESIKEVIQFIIKEVQFFENNPWEIKKSRCSNHFYHYVYTKDPIDEAITHFYSFIEMIEDEAKRLREMYSMDGNDKLIEPYEFNGVQKMTNNMKVVKNTKLDIGELREKRILLLKNLLGRVTMLKTVLRYSNQIPLTQYLQRYECDKKFRTVIEILLADIMSVFVACKIDGILKKSSNLLTDINLRNVLDHGNPFLEVIGNALDSQDFPTELIAWAMAIVEDGVSIEALYKLLKDNISYDAIKDNVQDDMTVEQQQSLNIFKQCKRWVDYLKFIPKVWVRPVDTTESSNTRLQELSSELVEAAKKNDLKGIKESIDKMSSEGIDGVNETDKHGKAALHYAAMKGFVQVIQVMSERGADVNVADSQNGKRPLHYACQNGHGAVVTTLLDRGSDCTIADNDKHLPLYYIKRNNEKLAHQVALNTTVQMGRCILCLVNQQL